MKTNSIILLILVSIFSFTFASFSSNKIEVEFKYHAPDAKSVNIPMEANGWDQNALPMKKYEDGWFRLKIKLAVGEYPYKFVVDKKKWVFDPNAPKIKIGKYTDNLLKVGTDAQIKAIKDSIKNLFSTILSEAKTLKNRGDLVDKKSSDVVFAVLGDNRSNTGIYEKIIREVKKHSPEFIINSGDLVTRPDKYDELLKFIQISKIPNVPYLPVPGNHDVRSKKTNKIFSELFGTPELIYYSFKYGDAEFFLLDTEVLKEHAKITGKQLEWLKKALKASKAKYKFAAFHRPMYPAKGIGHHHKDSLNIHPKLRDGLLELFKKYGVKYVYCGHEHFYNRQIHDGVTQIITGGAGAPLYADEAHGGFYHFLIVKINKDGVKTTVYKYNKKDDNFTVYEKF